MEAGGMDRRKNMRRGKDKQNQKPSKAGDRRRETQGKRDTPYLGLELWRMENELFQLL